MNTKELAEKITNIFIHFSYVEATPMIESLLSEAFEQYHFKRSEPLLKMMEEQYEYGKHSGLLDAAKIADSYATINMIGNTAFNIAEKLRQKAEE